MCPRTSRWFAATLLALLIGVLLVHLRRPSPHPLPAAPMQHEPLTILWAWETPEDLTALDPHTGVAFLARELFLTGHGSSAAVTVRPRMNPLRVSPSAWRMAVVRMEVAPNFRPNDNTAGEAAHAIAAAAQLPNVRAIQVDFDATASQRDLYLRILYKLRSDLPPSIPLSITALVSWCGPHSWLAPLRAMPSPVVDEAVPMFFRMGGPAASRALAPRTGTIVEPLCSTSLGLATDEAWPPALPTQRVYLFRSGPWTTKDIATIDRFGYQSLHEVPTP